MCTCHDHDHDPKFTRRAALTGTVALAAAATGLAASGAQAQEANPYAPPAEPFLPPFRAPPSSSQTRRSISCRPTVSPGARWASRSR